MTETSHLGEEVPDQQEPQDAANTRPAADRKHEHDPAPASAKTRTSTDTNRSVRSLSRVSSIPSYNGSDELNALAEEANDMTSPPDKGTGTAELEELEDFDLKSHTWEEQLAEIKTLRRAESARKTQAKAKFDEQKRLEYKDSTLHYTRKPNSTDDNPRENMRQADKPW